MLDLPPGARNGITQDGRPGTPWHAVNEKDPSWAKHREHLCAICTLKRLWPTLFAEDAAKVITSGQKPGRFVVSTHTMALSTSLNALFESGVADSGREASRKILSQLRGREPVALPTSLHRRLVQLGHQDLEDMIRKIPSLLDDVRELSDEQTRRNIEGLLGQLLGAKPEAYYAVVMMDGDRMGAWLSGSENRYRLTFEKSWHPQVRQSMDQVRSDPDAQEYLTSHRPPSPDRHAFISRALNDFSTHVARHVVEEVCTGKLLYSGGDDMLAMVSVDELLKVILLLRADYSGSGDCRGVVDDMRKEVSS